MENCDLTCRKEGLLRLVPCPNKPYCFKVELDLPTQKRFLGSLDTSGGGTFTTTRKAEHIFRKTNSFGLNFELQCFLSIDQFGIEKAREFRRVQDVQQNLFNQNSQLKKVS